MPKKQSTLCSNKKALNLIVVAENTVEDVPTNNIIGTVDREDIVEHTNQSTESDASLSTTIDLTQPKATLTIKQKQSSPKTPKSVKTIKMKDDTKSSKKKKSELVKRKRLNDSNCEVVDVDESHFIATKGKQTDEIIGSIASIFLTKEQRQRKKEIEVLNEQQKTQEKRKEINSIFCVQGGEHPLMKISKEKRKESQKESRKDVDLQSWQGVEPLACNITIESLREFGFCQNVGFSRIDIDQHQYTFNIDDLLLPENPTKETEYSKSFYENHPNTQSLIHKLTQRNETSKEKSPIIYHELNSKITDRFTFEDNCTNLIEESIENIYPQFMWNECKRKEKQLLKKSLERKYISLPESSKFVDLDGENSSESTTSMEGAISKKDTMDDLWSIKYKPNCYEHIISKNENSNQTLLEWLEKWRRPSTKKTSTKKEPNSKKRKTKKDDDLFTDDEYEQDDELEKSIILYGPTSGKSSSLHAIATQLGFEIMEVNSACDRSSKSIMELKETTQSKVIGSMGKIIVFEDADLKFQEESYTSFISSIEKLEKSTKRPIILISDTLSEQDLLNSVSKQRINFNCCEPFSMCTTEIINQHCKYIFDVCIYTSSILLCEGIAINVERDLLPLVIFFQGDLKKILLNLQFWFYKANTTPRLPHIEFNSTKSLLEKVLGLDSYFYEKTIDRFRHAEDDHEIMKNLDLPFFNYLNNLDHINSSFISILSEADTLRRFDNELSCNIYSTIEILATSTYLHNGKVFSSRDIKKSTELINSSTIPLTSEGAFSKNSLLKFKFQLSQSFLYTLVRHIINRQEYVCLHPSNYLYQRNMTDVIHHLFTMCNSENQRRENGSRRRFFHYLKTLIEDDELQKLEMLAKLFETKE